MKEYALFQILYYDNNWITSKVLTSALGISTRTLRTLVKEINTNDNIILSSKNGYKLNEEFKEYVGSYIVENKSTLNTNDKTIRQNYILKELILNHEPINFYDLADSLFVSETTLNNDLLFIRRRIETYDLILYRKNDNLSIIGKESNIRKLLSDNIYYEVKDGLLNFNVLSNIFPDYDVYKMRDIINETITKNNLSINDFGIADIILHICIMLNRVPDKKEKMEIHDNSINTRITKTILQKISKLTGIEIDNQEISNISPIIAVNTKQLVSANATLEEIGNIVDKEIISFVELIADNIENNFFLDIRRNNFVVRFSLHLNQLLNTSNKRNNNPLLKSIKDSYPLIFELSVYIADLINEHYGIKLSEHEMSYIALHVGMSIDKNDAPVKTILIIPNYYTLSDITVERLNSYFFNKIEIIDVYGDESKIDANLKYDLILSTQTLTIPTKAEYLQISPFINDKDISNVKYILEIIALKKKLFNYESLYSLFNSNTFTIYRNNNLNKEQIIRDLCDKAIELGYIDDKLVDDVLEREKLSSTSFSNIAVPHPLNPSMFNTKILVGVFKNNYKWDTNNINVVLLLIVNDKDKHEFKKIFQNIISIFTSKEWISSYKNIETFDDFMTIIKKC